MARNQSTLDEFTLQARIERVQIRGREAARGGR